MRREATVEKMMATFLLFALLSAGCAVSQRVEVYKIGDITFRLYDRREDLLKDVAPKLGPIQQAILGLSGQALGGHHDPATRTIYTIKNVYNLLHELKHELEPDWKHDLVCDRERCLKQEGER